MSDANLITLAESCSGVRVAIGRMLMAAEGSTDRVAAVKRFEVNLRELLRLAREERCGLFLEVAGELAV